MASFPGLKLQTESGEIEISFLPDDGIRINRKKPSLVCFDLKRVKQRYVYHQGVASYFMNCDEKKLENKLDLITTFEKIVNDWIDSHPVEKLQFDHAVLRLQVETSKSKIRVWQNYLKQMTDETKELVEGETKNIQDYEAQLAQVEEQILEAKRSSLQQT